MKKFLLAIATAFSVASASAQMASGSVCPDFTGTDINGQEWNLYNLLDQGYSVVVDVSATWCGPCWNYHNSGALETLYEEHGPNGTNEVMVLFIEGDAATTDADLHGTGTNTQGDWTSGSPYPIIDDASIGDLLQITYFPTIYTICPSRIITETGQITSAQHYQWIQENNCVAATLATDPSLVGLSATDATCSNGDVQVTVRLQNLGTQPLTSATILVSGGLSPVTYNWTGNLATYEIENVNVGTVVTNGSTTLTATITSADGDVSNSTEVTQAGVAQSTTNIRIDWLFDNWPEECSWEIADENGTVVASAPAGEYAGMTDAIVDLFLPSTGCYTFTYTDAYGDGLFGSQYGSIDGHCYVYGLDAQGNGMPYIYFYQGNYNLGSTPNVAASESRDANVTQTVGIQETVLANSFNVYPNPAKDNLNINYSIVKDAPVTIEVVNALGEVVISQYLGSKQAGMYNMQLDLSALSSGMYMVNIRANGGVSTTRVAVSK